jgi:hypothetical protein
MAPIPGSPVRATVIQGSFPGGRARIPVVASPVPAVQQRMAGPEPVQPPSPHPTVAQRRIPPGITDRLSTGVQPGLVHPRATPPLAHQQRMPQPILPQPRGAHPQTVQLRSVSPLAHHQGLPQPILPHAPGVHPQAVQPRSAAPQGPVVQRNANGEAFQLPANLANFGGTVGQPLPDPVRQKMESFFNTSFADVRVHVGPQASSVGAVAFTHGSNLYFAPGQYNPNTAHGQQLLGHELTHVVQQRSGRVKNPFGSGVAVVQDRTMEAEADRLGLGAAAHQNLDRDQSSGGFPTTAPNFASLSATAQPMSCKHVRTSLTRASRTVQRMTIPRTTIYNPNAPKKTQEEKEYHDYFKWKQKIEEHNKAYPSFFINMDVVWSNTNTIKDFIQKVTGTMKKASAPKEASPTVPTVEPTYKEFPEASSTAPVIRPAKPPKEPKFTPIDPSKLGFSSSPQTPQATLPPQNLPLPQVVHELGPAGQVTGGPQQRATIEEVGRVLGLTGRCTQIANVQTHGDTYPTHVSLLIDAGATVTKQQVKDVLHITVEYYAKDHTNNPKWWAHSGTISGYVDLNGETRNYLNATGNELLQRLNRVLT